MRPVTGSGGRTLESTRSRRGSTTTMSVGSPFATAHASPAIAPAAASVTGVPLPGQGPRSMRLAAILPSGRTTIPL